jgi:hypothetical protein
MLKWVIRGTNGDTEVTKAESLKVLKSDVQNSYNWEGDTCVVLLWTANPFYINQEVQS